MALINFYVFVRRTQDANGFLFFLALYIVKLQLDGEKKISESCDSLSFIKDSVFGTSRCCFLIVPKMVVFFVINSSANFRLVKNGNYQRWSPRGRPWPRGRPRGQILKSLALALASRPQVLENWPVLGSRTALFFGMLKFCGGLEKFFGKRFLVEIA